MRLRLWDRLRFWSLDAAFVAGICAALVAVGLAAALAIVFALAWWAAVTIAH